MQPVQDIYSDETRAMVDAYNAKLTSVETERSAIDRERAAIAADALAGETTAPKLLKRLDTIRARALQVDIDEHLAHGDLPAIHAAAKADWTAERDRRRAAVEARVAELNRHADELEMAKRDRHGLILADARRREDERAAQHAHEQSAKGPSPVDIARVEQLRVSIAQALR